MDPSPLSEHTGPGTVQRPTRAATVLLLVVLAVVAAFLSFRGMFLGYWVDECGVITVPCEPGLFRAGLLTGMLSPIAVLVLAFPLAIVLMVLHRRSVWVPLIAIVVTIGLHIIAAVLVDVALRA